MGTHTAAPAATIAPRDALPEQAGTGPQLDRLRRLAAEHGVGTLVLREPATLSWLTGARWNIQQSLHASCFDIVLTGLDGGDVSARVVTNAIEAPRLRDVELAHFLGGDLEFDAVAWDEDRTSRLPGGPTVGGDVPGAGRADLTAALAAERLVLTTEQRRLLAGVAADTTRVTGEVARGVRAGQREREIAGRLCAGLLDAGLEPIVYFVGSDERLVTHKHPLATGRVVERVVMLAVCARRHGLVASVTRFVALRPLVAADQRRYRALLDVEAAFLDATRPGTTLGEAFTAGVAGYAVAGFAPDQWRTHHQGGLSGFAPREVLATSGATVRLAPGMVLGWNPSGGGWKVEDTTLVTESGPQPLDVDPTWPHLTVAGRPRPGVLEL